MQLELIILIILALYFAFLFCVAYWVDHSGQKLKRFAHHPLIYALAIAVYCSTWTFYGSVGFASRAGASFLPVYLGPTIVFLLTPFIFQKIVRIAKTYHITSIADFLGARYGNSHLIAAMVTIIAVIGIMPYISLQLKAVATSYDIIHVFSQQQLQTIETGHKFSENYKGHFFAADTAFYVTCLLAMFTIFFSTRKIDASEQHAGVVVVVAIECVVKLFAFLLVGIFVTYFMYDGVGDIMKKALALEKTQALINLDNSLANGNWITLLVLSMCAAVLLPRQFQVTVIENTNEDNLKTASWAFPLYLFLINLFVIPITFAGLHYFQGQNVASDTFVLMLPLMAGHEWVAIITYIGGISAATGMAVVATIALSTMLCNDLILPLLIYLQKWFGLSYSFASSIKTIRRLAICVILALAYLYVYLIGNSYALVTIGLLSFAAAAQFAPAMFGALYWKEASKKGAFFGLLAGFTIWLYTLLIPSFIKSGWLPQSILDDGLFNIGILRPYQLFGMEGLSSITHGVFWSLSINILVFIAVSLATRQSQEEIKQARSFVDIYHQTRGEDVASRIDDSVTIKTLVDLTYHMIGTEEAKKHFLLYQKVHGIKLDLNNRPNNDFIQLVERILSGAIGRASTNVVMESTLRRSQVDVDHVLGILDQASEAIKFNKDIMEALIANVGQGVAMFDNNGALVAWNPKLLEHLKLPDQEVMVGRSIFENFLRHGHRKVIRCKPEEVSSEVEYFLDGANCVAEFTFDDGAVLEMRGAPIENGNFVFTYTDITGRVLIENELREHRDKLGQMVRKRTKKLEEEIEHRKKTEGQLLASQVNLLKLTAAVEQSPASIVITDLDGKIEYVNKRFEEVTGYPANKVIGNNPRILKSGHTPPEGYEELWKTISNGGTWRGTFQNRKKSGELYWEIATISPIRNAQGQMTHYLGVKEDITERREIENALEAEKEHNRLQKEFISMVSHEFRTPLAIIDSGSQRILRRRDKITLDEVFERIGTFRQMIKRLTELVESTLSLSRFDSGKIKFNPAPLNLKQLVLDETTKMKDIAGQRLIIADVDGLPTQVEADADHLTKVISNLLSNAIKYSPDHSEIKINGWREGDNIKISVADQGVGIPKEEKARMFNRFFRASTSTGIAGTGIGLYLVKQLMEMHGGNVGFESEPGIGSAFTITLPISAKKDKHVGDGI